MGWCNNSECRGYSGIDGSTFLLCTHVGDRVILEWVFIDVQNWENWENYGLPMSTKIVPRPTFVDQGIPLMSTEYGITCEIDGEASLSGEFSEFDWSKSSWSPCDMRSWRLWFASSVSCSGLGYFLMCLLLCGGDWMYLGDRLLSLLDHPTDWSTTFFYGQ